MALQSGWDSWSGTSKIAAVQGQRGGPGGPQDGGVGGCPMLGQELHVTTLSKRGWGWGDLLSASQGSVRGQASRQSPACFPLCTASQDTRGRLRSRSLRLSRGGAPGTGTWCPHSVEWGEESRYVKYILTAIMF